MLIVNFIILFSHATNDCNVLHRKIQSAIDEGRLVIPAMQVDRIPFPVHMLELENPKVLIRPHQAKSTKGKNVIIGEERPEKKVLQSKTSRATAKASMLGGQGKKTKAGNKTTSLTGASTSLTGTQTSLTGESSNPGNSSKTKNRAKLSFKELLAKYEKEGAAQEHKRWPNKAKDAKSSSRSCQQSESHSHQGNCGAMPHSFPEPVAL